MAGRSVEAPETLTRAPGHTEEALAIARTLCRLLSSDNPEKTLSCKVVQAKECSALDNVAGQKIGRFNDFCTICYLIQSCLTCPQYVRHYVALTIYLIICYILIS